MPESKPAQRSADDTYRFVRNQLRKYNLISIAEVGLMLLSRRFKDSGDEMTTAPWLIFLMLKWAFQDRLVHKTLGLKMTPDVFVGIQQRLWDVGPPEGQPMTTNAVRFVRSLSYVQIEFQRPEALEFARWPSILASLPAEHPVRLDFEAAFGVTPQDFLDLVLAVYSKFLLNDGPMTPDYFKLLETTYGPKVNRVLALLSRDVDQLRDTLSAEIPKNRPTPVAVREFPVFRRFPLLRGANGLHWCWHRKVLSRGVEEFIHNALSRRGGAYSEAYGKVFEQHVVATAHETGLNALDEEQFWMLFGRTKHAVEVILRDDDCNVFIEAKFGLFQDEYITFDDAGFARARLKKLSDGVDKAAEVSNQLTAHPEMHAFGERRKDFLLLITNRQLHLPTGRQLEAMRSVTLDEVDEYVRLSATPNLPVENVFILSVDEYERLMVAVANGDVRLVNLLSALAARATDPATWSMSFGQMAAGTFDSRHLSPLVERGIESATLRLAHALGVPHEPSQFPWLTER